ncbi:hypothetical protein ATCC90586_007593 [Pythium insidiosum]|nr:hypothetical protein ATCC90586_007593 [Pythium insidiosum]
MKHTPAERQRVLEAFDSGGPWKQVAAANGFKRTAMYDLINSRAIEDKPRGGYRECRVKVTLPMLTSLEAYIEDDCTVTLEAMREKLSEEYGVQVSTSTISRYTIGMLYTMKEMRREMAPMNSIEKRQERREFVVALNAHRADGSMIVYLDETNYNVYLSRGRGAKMLFSCLTMLDVMSEPKISCMSDFWKTNPSLQIAFIC